MKIKELCACVLKGLGGELPKVCLIFLTNPLT